MKRTDFDKGSKTNRWLNVTRLHGYVMSVLKEKTICKIAMVLHLQKKIPRLTVVQIKTIPSDHLTTFKRKRPLL